MAKMEWLKLYTEARRDAKLECLTDSEFRVWFNLLCFAAEQDGRGEITYDDMDLLAIEVSSKDVDLLASCLGKLVKLKIVTHGEGVIAFAKFSERQCRKPSDTPEATAQRKREQRARDRETSQTVTAEPETSRLESNNNDTCHAASHGVTRSHDIDRDRDIEKRREEKDPQTPTRGISAQDSLEKVGVDTDPTQEAPVGRSKIPPPKYRPNDFRHFYASYPAKDDPAGASKAWDTLRPDEDDLKAIELSLAPFQERKLNEQEKTKCPSPARWLKERKFDSDVPFKALSILDDEHGRSSATHPEAAQTTPERVYSRPYYSQFHPRPTGAAH